MPNSRITLQTTWRYWLIAINLFFVAMTVLAPYVPRSEPIGYLFRAFSLGLEMNVGAWWSGVCLLAAALLAYELTGNHPDGNGISWLILALIFTGLSLDEIGSLHERAGGWSNIIPIAGVGALFLGYALVRLYRNQATRRASLTLLAAFGLFGIVAIQEWIEDAVQWPLWMAGVRVGIEEGTEIASATLVLFALVRQRQHSLHSPAAILPNPLRLPHLPAVMLGGLMVHLLLSLLADYYVRTGPGGHGSPAAWYPAAVFFVLALAYFRIRAAVGQRRRKWLFALAGFFIVASIGCLYAITPRAATSVLNASVQGLFFYTFLLGLIALPVLLANLARTFQWKRWPLIGALVVVLVVSVVAQRTMQTYFARYILAGVISYGLSVVHSIESEEKRTAVWR